MQTHTIALLQTAGFCHSWKKCSVRKRIAQIQQQCFGSADFFFAFQAVVFFLTLIVRCWQWQWLSVFQSYLVISRISYGAKVLVLFRGLSVSMHTMRKQLIHHCSLIKVLIWSYKGWRRGWLISCFLISDFLCIGNIHNPKSISF